MMKAWLEILLGLALFPVVAGFIVAATSDANVATITGMTIIIPLVGIAFGFGLIYKGIKGLDKK